MTKLDRALMFQVRRKPRPNEMTFAERVAVNVLWRDKVPPSIIAKVFKRSKNTFFLNSLTGERRAREINDFVESIGVDEARRRYVTDDMIRAVHEAGWTKIARAPRITVAELIDELKKADPSMEVGAVWLEPKA